MKRFVTNVTIQKNGMQLQGHAVAKPLQTADARTLKNGIKISNFAALLLLLLVLTIVQNAKENGT